jgi:vibriolysin
MTVSVTYQGWLSAATMANPMGPNTVVNAGTPVDIDSGKSGSDRPFYVEVPAGATSVQFATESLPGASGDADLFVKFGAQATRTAFDQSSTTAASSTESVTVASPQPGGWYIDVSGASDYTKVRLAVTVK